MQRSCQSSLFRRVRGPGGSLVAQESVLLHAEDSAAEAEHTGGHVENWKQRAAEGIQARDSILGRMADLVKIHRPHILATDHVVPSRWAAPIADRIVAELESEKNAHPLIQGGLAGNSTTLASAVRAVNYAVGRIANELSWEKKSGGGIPDELWIDTGLTPQQLAEQESPPA